MEDLELLQLSSCHEGACRAQEAQRWSQSPDWPMPGIHASAELSTLRASHALLFKYVWFFFFFFKLGALNMPMQTKRDLIQLNRTLLTGFYFWI